MSETVSLNTKGLDKLLKALGRLPRARVGVLGDKAVRGASEHDGEKKESGPTNAEIGAAHEYGTSTLPQRSFLRVPISDNLSKALDNAGLMDKDAVKKVLAEGSVVPWLKKIAIVAEDIVLQAFDNGGFGKWKPSNMKNKTNHQTLVETQQLRNSITSEVDDE